MLLGPGLLGVEFAVKNSLRSGFNSLEPASPLCLPAAYLACVREVMVGATGIEPVTPISERTSNVQGKAGPMRPAFNPTRKESNQNRSDCTAEGRRLHYRRRQVRQK